MSFPVPKDMVWNETVTHGSRRQASTHFIQFYTQVTQEAVRVKNKMQTKLEKIPWADKTV